MQASESAGYTDILAELKVLGTIRCGQKINTSQQKITVEYPTTLNGILRWWKGETRDKNIASIHKTLNKTFSLIDTALVQPENKRNHILLARILEGLERAAEGISRLKTTYEYDAHSAALIDVAIENSLLYRNLLMTSSKEKQLLSDR